MKKCTEYTLGKTIISSEYDDMPMDDIYGTYDQKYTEGCIVRADGTFYEDHIEETNKENDDGYPLYEVPTIRGEYSFFHPADNGEKFGTEEYRKYAMQDYQRMVDYNNSEWCYLVLKVETTITTNTGLTDTVFATLCNVESDQGKEELNAIIDELKSEVKDQLCKMGFSYDEINQSVDNAETKKGEMYL
jgi:hypothetical protein